MNLHKSTCLVLAAVILAAGAGSARADYDSARGWFSAKPKRERLLIQEALMALELYEGPADGLFGARTYRALVDFEDDVRADGVLSAAQQASLLDGGDGAGSSGSKSDESVTAWSGSGFAISDESILTNYHVVEGCRAIQVAGLGEATVVSSDKLHDLAVVKVARQLTAKAIVQADPIELGQAVIALGYPLSDLMGDALTVSPGVVASLTGLGGDPTNFTVSANIQPGNSGGPILDLDGNVVGVAVAKLDEAEMLRTAGTTAGPVGFAINTDTVLDFLSAFKVAVADVPVRSNGSIQTAVAKAKAFTHQILCEGAEE